METGVSLGGRILGWLGIAAHLAVGVWYAASGLVAPTWAVVVLLAVWVAMSALIPRLWRTHPGWVAAVPVVEALFWFAFISAGEAFLNWTA
jgi:hypothetical protein